MEKCIFSRLVTVLVKEFAKRKIQVMGQLELSKKLEDIFIPYKSEATKVFKKSSVGFAHYTSADACHKILESKTLWMRNVAVLNDLKEFEIGRKVVLDYLNPESSSTEALEKLFELIEELVGLNKYNTYQSLKNNLMSWEGGVFVTSFTEHLIGEEVENGRLSMWRGYGGEQSKAAIVFKDFTDWKFENASFFLAPVIYSNGSDLDERVEKLYKSVLENKDFLSQYIKEDPAEALKSIMGHFLVFFITYALTLKDLGFEEEREWRLIHSKNSWATPVGVNYSVEVIHGIPQVVTAIKFRNSKGVDPNIDGGLLDVEFDDFISNVIVGPSNFQRVIADSFEHSFKKNFRFPEPSNLIFLSKTPLRTHY
jgi:hypothetical protein